MSIKDMHNISYFIFIAGLFVSSVIYSQTNTYPTKSTLNPPLDIPLLLSSNYGEYRAGHFHAGLDFKTQQVEGKNVFAVDSGYVYRIVVLTGSYGNAVYLKHPSGMISLYGHLSQFEPKLARYVKEQQYKNKSYTIDVFPDTGKFIFAKGEIIGLSGNSGSSFGPHLHFEIRDETGAIPLNPLKYGFNISDKTRPVINWLMLYSINKSLINGINKNTVFKTSLINNEFFINDDTITIRGKFGIGIEAYDFLDNSTNECGPYTIEMLSDNKQFFFCKLDSIPFNSGAYINSYFDYSERLRTGRKFQKLFIDPNNDLDIYKVAENRGIINFNDSLYHLIKIKVIDTYGNESVLSFHIKSEIQDNSNDLSFIDSNYKLFSFNTKNVFQNEDIKVTIPEKALFDNIYFTYSSYENDSFKFSPVHKVQDRYTPLLNSYNLSVKANNLTVGLEDKAYIASRGAGGLWYYEGGEYKNGFINTKVKVFGEFTIFIDTLPPVINPVKFRSKATYQANGIFTFQITDNQSGIAKYEGYIDKNWALFEYDAKNDLLKYIIDPEKINKGKMHQIDLIVTDNKGNSSGFSDYFYY